MEGPNTCKQISAQLDDYIDGEIKGDARAAIGKHIQTCEQCASRLAATVCVVGSLKALPRPSVPKSLSDKLDAIAEQPQARPSNVVAMRRGAWLAAAAAAAVTLVAAASLSLHSGTSTALLHGGKQATAARVEVANNAGSKPAVTTSENRQPHSEIANGVTPQHEQGAHSSPVKNEIADNVPQHEPVLTPHSPALENSSRVADNKLPHAGVAKADRAASESPTIAQRAPRMVPMTEPDNEQSAGAETAMAPERIEEPSQEEPGFRSIADLPSAKGSFDSVGVATDEDGLYDIQM